MSLSLLYLKLQAYFTHSPSSLSSVPVCTGSLRLSGVPDTGNQRLSGIRDIGNLWLSGIRDTGNRQLSGIQDTVQFVIMSIFRDFLVSGTPVIGGYPVSGTLEIVNYPVSWTPDSHFKTWITLSKFAKIKNGSIGTRRGSLKKKTQL